jgi:ATP-binding cassette subfamily F protein 3
MLTVHQISKSYGIEAILEGVTFSLNLNERLGLVGPNGCGKTTLMRILTGHETPERGVVRFNPPDLSVGYLPQQMDFLPEDRIGDFLNRMEGNSDELSARLAGLAEELVRQPGRAALQREYDRVLVKLDLASQNAGRGPRVLAGLGLGEMPAETPVAHLSGGQKTRLALAGVLLSNPRLLLLDEPTNHLDLAMLDWLEKWLLEFNGGVLVVSHDRAFLDRVATGILEIDPVSHALRQFAGNYSAYLAQKRAERERQTQEYTDQKEEIARLRRAAQHVRSLARAHKGGKADPANTDGFSAGFFADRGLETIARAKRIEKRLERLLNEDKIEKPGQTWAMKIEFGETRVSGRIVLACEGLSIGYNGMALLHDLNQTLRLGERAVLVGPNGSGKTTLLRTIAGLHPPLAGQARLGANVHPGYMAQEQSEFDPGANALEAILSNRQTSETDARSFLSKFLFKGDDVFIPSDRLSSGERARLSLACLVARGCNFLLLDEPLNHLDISARERFEESLSGFEGTVLVVAHDRYFIERFASQVWEIEDGNLAARENR